MGNSSSTGVCAVQTGDKVDRLAVQVCMEVDGRFGKDSSTTRIEGFSDESRPIFSD